MKMPISDIVIPPRRRKHLGDLARLAASMATLGQLQAIGVFKDDDGIVTLLFGERRLRAAVMNDWPHIEVQFIEVNEPVLAENDENEAREGFRLSEKVAIAREIERRLGKQQGRRTDLEPTCGQSPTSEQATAGTRKTRDAAAARAGFASCDEFRRAAKVVDAGVPELVAAMDLGEVSPSAAATIATQLTHAVQQQLLAEGPIAVKRKAKELRTAKEAKSGGAAQRKQQEQRLTSLAGKDEPRVVAPSLPGLLREDEHDAVHADADSAEAPDLEHVAFTGTTGDSAPSPRAASNIDDLAAHSRSKAAAFRTVGSLIGHLHKLQSDLSELMNDERLAQAIRQIGSCRGVTLEADGTYLPRGKCDGIPLVIRKYSSPQVEDLLAFAGAVKSELKLAEHELATPSSAERQPHRSAFTAVPDDDRNMVI